MGNNDYTSARMISKGKFEFQYGRVEIRAKLPQGQGTWPAPLATRWQYRSSRMAALWRN